MKRILLYILLVLCFSSVSFAQDTVNVDESDKVEVKEVSEKDDAIEIVEEDGDMLLVEEEDDFLISDDEEESILTVAPEKESVTSKDSSTEIVDSSNIADEKVVAQEKNSVQQDEKVKASGEDDPQIEEVVAEEITPVVIDSVKKINFAKNLKDYKSPRKAMFRSLLLPGWGQGYAKKYWKTGVFAGLEVGAIIGVAAMNYLGSEKGKDAVSFAKNNYSKGNFIAFYEKYLSYVKSEYADPSNISLQQGKTTAAQFDSLADIAVVQDMFYGDSISNFKNNTANVKLEEMWEGNYYIAGWKDFPTSEEDAAVKGYYFNANTGYVIDSAFKDVYQIYNADSANTDTTWYIDDITAGKSGKGKLGFSSLRDEYQSIRDEEREYYDRGMLFVGLLILNHVTSAIDAFITAKAYNDELLEKESVWRHLGLENQIAYSSEEGISTTLGLKIKF